jgi:hypothetical protein
MMGHFMKRENAIDEELQNQFKLRRVLINLKKTVLISSDDLS